MARRLWITGFGVAMIFAAWMAWRQAGTVAVVSATQTPASPADARQQQILKMNAGRAGDPDLIARFTAINTRHFGGALPPTSVRWEPALAEVGPLLGEGVTLHGMFGRAGDRTIILLNPAVRGDAQALDRAICHEMVHAYLFAMGDKGTTHGPAFQSVLQRLSREGAFEGIAADAGEKSRLRAWLDAESQRIDGERREMEVVDAEIAQTRADLDREISDFNARAVRPPAAAQELDARRQHFNQRMIEANERLQQDRDDLAHFNAEVARYNLIMGYPDGMDEATQMASKPPLAAPGRR